MGRLDNPNPIVFHARPVEEHRTRVRADGDVDQARRECVITHRDDYLGNRAAESEVNSLHRSHSQATVEPFDALEIFQHLREISDPEHPHTLEQV